MTSIKPRNQIFRRRQRRRRERSRHVKKADMNTLIIVIAVQTLLLAYHQITTWFDLSPFNGARHYTNKERLAETGVNAILMSLPPIGFALHNHGLMIFGVVYYFVLLTMEIVIWWIPYISMPSHQWRTPYNSLLALATSNFTAKDPLNDWLAVHERIHADTMMVLPRIRGRIVPNLEHMILHGWTAITAIVTASYYFS